MAQADVTGQLENGRETFTGQVVGGDLTLRGSSGRTCQGSVDNLYYAILVSCSDGTSGSISMQFVTARDQGAIATGTIGDQNVNLSVGPFSCPNADGIVTGCTLAVADRYGNRTVNIIGG
ncbi:hypothetical protein GCM10007094_30740 [Pseudovibrio japonicus]|uniref:Uncharacterized protein n=1 Tax=Pseudovibrio japonicus TaxID=366534 RepID=A0ABQ3EKI8_9HYPH|nr:hypothetical protein GCM10007094_30740 [Pseudovibrio japonicus]